MRIALFGGAFDPIHNGHLRIAREAIERCNLDKVLFVPAAHPPHKKVHTSYEDRYQMCALTTLKEAKMAPSRLEADTEQSYSIDTIEKLRKELEPDDKLFFLIGADAFAEIKTWKRWRDVVAAVDFIVVSRPGHRYEVAENARVTRLDTLHLPISSSEVRKQLAAGQNQVDLPAAAFEYIREKRLYSGAVHAPLTES